MGVFERGLAALPAYKSLCGDIRAGRLPAGLTGLGHIHKVLMIHALAATLGRRSLLLVADEAEASEGVSVALAVVVAVPGAEDAREVAVPSAVSKHQVPDY